MAANVKNGKLTPASGWIGVLVCGLILNANAGLFLEKTFDGGFLNDGSVPDGNRNGWTDTRVVEGPGGLWGITDVELTLNLSGGYNGDFYAYLAHNDGFVVLLNRVGVGQASGTPFGYFDPGMSVTFRNAGEKGDIHWYGGSGPPSGAYVPDARNLDPLSASGAFDTATRSATFGSFSGLDPMGQWTLFVADVVAGGGSSKVLNWRLQVGAMATPVPEPGAFGLIALAIGLCAWNKTRPGREAAARWGGSSPCKKRSQHQHPANRPTPSTST